MICYECNNFFKSERRDEFTKDNLDYLYCLVLKEQLQYDTVGCTHFFPNLNKKYEGEIK